MTINKVLTPFAFVAVLAFAAAPALAGQRRDGGRSSGRSSSGSRGAVRGGGGVTVRGGGGFAVRGGGVIRGGSFYRPSYVRPYYSRPFYTFRPRLSLGFGLWMGYPVDYYGSPYGYAYPGVDPYAYDVAPSYGYPAQPYGYANPSSAYPPANYPPSNYPSANYPAQQRGPSVGSQRGGQSAPGGISFEITPANATVFVDGTNVGTTGDFGPTGQPLDLSAGRHHIEVRASGYRTMTFDADVQPGQVIPYQGSLQRN
jgi:hypothetical protein